MATVLTGSEIDQYRILVLLSALKLEMLGIKRSRGSTAYSILKKEFNLKGDKQSVYNQVSAMIALD
jgi:hypothetical protein